MAFIALPASGAGFVGTNYSGKVIEVMPGGIFVLRTELLWDEPDVPGYYGVTIIWEDNNRADENFTVLYARAFFDNDNDNSPDAGVAMIENSSTLSSGTGTNGRRWTFYVNNTTGNENNGYLDVEIYVQAATYENHENLASPVKAFHRALWDNHPINKPGWGGTIDYAESTIGSTIPAVTTIKVLKWGVDVSISPSYQSGLQGENLNYEVLVKNTGGIADNYSLTVSDNENWAPTLDDNRFDNVPPGENRTTTLRVRVPDNAAVCTMDKITVIATSAENAVIKDNDSCIAHATRGVQVMIEPPSQENRPGGNLTFIVTIKNDGDWVDNYDLTVSDNSGWNPSLDNTRFENVNPGETENTTLRVTVPENARQRIEDKITVVATSQYDNTIKDNASCIAYSLIIRGVSVSISPENRSGLRGWTLDYTVTVWNRGNIVDNFGLENLDNLGWPMLLDNYTLSIENGENMTTTLHVTIDNNATPCTRDNVRIIVTSLENADVRAENMCTAHLARVTFEVSISPSSQSRLRGENLTYTVTVRNTTTDNVDFKDNYDLTISDNSGWLPSLLDNRIENVGRGEENSENFTVTIPVSENASPCTGDNITITARSQADNRENRSGSCIAHSLAVDISIMPSENSALPGDNLTYAVNISSTSTSSENDNFGLTVSDNSGWGPILSENVVSLSAGIVATVTLTVTIPENAIPCTRDKITVTVTSENDNTVRDNASCTAHAGYAGVSVSITPENQEENRGGNLTYTVTVKNMGTITDNIRLTVQDNADPYPSWNPTLDEENFYVENGGTRTTTLRVEVSWYSPPGTYDNITVTATSQENANVSDNASCIAYSKLLELMVYPTDDAHVREAAFDNNYENDNLYVGRIFGELGVSVRSFLKFDLPMIPVGSTIENAWLYLYAYGRYGIGEVVGENVQCHSVGDDSWSENTITWDSQPSIGVLLDGPKELSYPPPRPSPNSWVVTDFVENQFRVDNKVSLAMVGAGENRPSDHYVIFNSKEYDNKPYLRILYRPNRDLVKVSISPENRSVFRGGTAEYTVTVTNLGWENNTYRLENWDYVLYDEPWPMALDNVQLDVPPGENRTTTLRVTVPSAAAPCYSHSNITVKAISVDNENIYDSARCTAHSALIAFTVSISPYGNGNRGENLGYRVTVTNVGTIPDNYTLEVWDNAYPYPSWYPWLDNYTLGPIQPNENERTNLRVTVSWYSPPGTADRVSVRVTSRTDNTKKNENSCIAYSNLLEAAIYPIDDAYVWENSPDRNYGIYDSDYLYAGRKWDGAVRSFLKFDLSTILYGSTIENAWIYLYVPPGGIRGGGENVQCRHVDNDNWYENTITWNKQPVIGGLLDNKPVTENIWYSWDVTSFVASQFGGDNKVSLAMVGAGENRRPDHYVDKIHSKDFVGGKTPYLKVLYIPPRDSVLVSISPSLQSELRAENDAHVMEKVPDNNYGADNLYAGRRENGAVRSFLRFDLPPIPPGSIIENAQIYLYVPGGGIMGGGENVQCHRVDNDNWREAGVDNITWNKKPVILGLLDNKPVTDDVTWYSWDVTSFVASQFGGDNKVSLAMVGAGENNPPDHYVLFNSKEYDNKPYLKVLYRLPHDFHSRLRGENLTYTVTVRNLGWENNTYRLENWDNLGWTIALDNDMFDNIPPGENRTTVLRVTIPENATPCTSDNITVRATSVGKENSYHSANCIGHSLSVHISITSPPYPSAVRGDNLTYTVTISSTSTSLENDNFRLENLDKLGWGLLILPYENIGVSSVENGTATLTVTIPEDENICTLDNIIVTVTSQADNTVRDNASCTAHAGDTGIVVSISPKYSENFPGGNIYYDVTIKNTGTVVENFELVEVIVDNENWNWNISSTFFEDVPPGGENHVTLTVEVPSGAAHCTTDNITVKWGATVAYALSRGEIYPSDDTYVFEGSRNANFGGEGELKIYPIFTEGGMMPWLKFQLSLPPGAENIWRAKLYLYFSDLTVPAKEVTTGAYFSENDNWDENTITWNNMPFPNPASWDNVAPIPTDSILLGKKVKVWKSWDVTPDAQRELVGDNKVSWCLKNEKENDNYVSGTAYSKEYTDNKPYLEIIGENESRGIKYATDKCTAHATRLKIKFVSIEPENQEGLRKADVAFRITIINDGIEKDNYLLTVVDDAGWGNLRFDNSSFRDVNPTENRWTYLRVRIPDNATLGMRNNLKVIIVSVRDPNISENDNCVVLVKPAGVEVRISPSENEGLPGENLAYTVTVKNLGNVQENFLLAKGDNTNWTLGLDDNWLLVPSGENRTTRLTVKIPDNARGCTWDNIWVKATSKENAEVFDNKSCLAHVRVVRGVDVSISPSPQSGAPGTTLSYTVTVRNTGDNADNFDLAVSGGAGWAPTLADNWLSIAAGASKTTTLTVTVPSGGTSTTITVTATSRADNTVKDSASCVANVAIVRGVDVSISPENQTGEPGDSLTFIVTVKNTGGDVDTYDLTASDDAGWGASLDENLLTILAGENTTVAVNVTVRSDAIEWESTMIAVTATSRTDNTVSDSDTCTATARKEEVPPPPILPIVVGGAAVGGGVAIALLLKKGIIHLPSFRPRRSRFLRSHP